MAVILQRHFRIHVSINKMPTLVQIMAWCRMGDNPLFKPNLLT